MPVSVKVYYGQPTASTVEIRRFVLRTEQSKTRNAVTAGIYQALIERIRSVFNGLNLHNFHLCWKDDDGDYVVFSSDEELRVAINNTKDNTLRIYMRQWDHARRPIPIDDAVYSRMSRKGDPCRSHRHRRSARSASASRDSDGSPVPYSNWHHPLSKDTANNGGAVLDIPAERAPSTQLDSGTSTSSGVVEQSSGTMKESSNEDIAGPPRTRCSHCQGQGRRGVFYQCTVCRDYFLCSDCEHQGLHDQHIMVRIRSDQSKMN